MLQELAIGDAYGAGFEYASAEHVAKHNTLGGYVANEKHALKPGCYTDDTQMSIAVAECLLSGKPLTRELFADAFVAVFKRDEREGYAGGFYKFLQSVADGSQFIERIKPFSDKSGAAMRAVPIGVLKKIDDVKSVCSLQASLTHDTPGGINAALATALAAHYFAYELGDRSGLGKFLDGHVEGDWSEEWSGKVGEKGYMPVKAAFTALRRNNTLSGILKDSVAFTGDVDTVACIALGLGSLAPAVSKDLPKVLVDNLENGAYGRDFIANLDLRLLAAID